MVAFQIPADEAQAAAPAPSVGARVTKVIEPFKFNEATTTDEQTTKPKEAPAPPTVIAPSWSNAMTQHEAATMRLEPIQLESRAGGPIPE